jgi:hypothetical protein
MLPYSVNWRSKALSPVLILSYPKALPSLQIIKLYQAVPASDEPCHGNRPLSRMMELDKKALVFSFSRDHSMVRTYGHYASTQDNKATFYHHPICIFDFILLD